jgi:CHAT domain-containing protein
VALIAEKQANEPHFEIIHQVDAEVNAIAAVAGSSRVQKCLRLSGDTTVSGTCETMQDANIIHLACHGIQNGNDALQSGFCLGDGRLTISKLMELNLDNAFLAFLSACETAKGDKNQPDQVMHLAAAMMFTGFKTVIATMWYACVLVRSH